MSYDSKYTINRFNKVKEKVKENKIMFSWLAILTFMGLVIQFAEFISREEIKRKKWEIADLKKEIDNCSNNNENKLGGIYEKYNKCQAEMDKLATDKSKYNSCNGTFLMVKEDGYAQRLNIKQMESEIYLEGPEIGNPITAALDSNYFTAEGTINDKTGIVSFGRNAGDAQAYRGKLLDHECNAIVGKFSRQHVESKILGIIRLQ